MKEKSNVKNESVINMIQIRESMENRHKKNTLCGKYYSALNAMKSQIIGISINRYLQKAGIKIAEVRRKRRLAGCFACMAAENVSALRQVIKSKGE